MRYRLSLMIPVPMETTYRRGDTGERERCRWWQWRDRYYAIRREAA